MASLEASSPEALDFSGFQAQKKDVRGRLFLIIWWAGVI